MTAARVRFDEVIKLYDRMLAEFGCTATGVHWESATRQVERYALLATLFDGPCTVNDFGCGYGGFFEYARHRLPIGRYHGVDVSAAMVAAARAYVPDHRATFSCAAVLSKLADYSIASGVFAVPGGNPPGAWQAWTREAITAMWNCSRRGMAFNMLRSDAPGMSDAFAWGDPDATAAWCRSAFAEDVELVMPEGWNDWTILVRRPATAVLG